MGIDKDPIREELLGRREALDEKEYLEKSSRIIGSLKELDEFREAGTVHCYVSMNSRREVNTIPLVKELAQSEKRLLVPVTDFETGLLDSVYLDDFDKLEENKWGVLEPLGEAEPADPSDIDLVVVPMVGGDRRGNRIGYGKGFYDRFLSEMDCPKIGLLFECCLLKVIVSESFDVPMDLLITENAVIRP